jgi:uncharacterized 2Fe-2S/4Fe-4S cluster protein (DUF4445 family)
VGTHRVTFLPSGRRGDVPDGATVLEAARALGADLDSVCGGRGVCSKCQVRPVDGRLGEATAVEARYDRVRGLAPGRRLGCQARILGDATLDVPPESQIPAQVVRKAATDRAVEVAPATRLHTVSVAQPDIDAPTGDAERLLAALAADGAPEGLALPPALLPRLQPLLREGGWRVTAAVNAPLGRVVALWPGTAPPALGLAVDLGSTTIAAHLCDLATGEVLVSGGRMNPQIRFGEDLMSRVSHAMLHPDGTVAMRDAVREALDELAGELAERAGAPREAICEAVIVGNPVMHHLLLGIDPSPLGQAPFALAVQGPLDVDAAALGLRLAPGACVHLPPLIAGHVGADAAAVALAEAPDEADALTLIVDVGTNAEIILGSRAAGVLACSSPTGPAFEGAQISAGQRAAPGAIERVRIDPETKAIRFRTIGAAAWSDAPGFDGTVTGICGSGIIEAVAEMRLAGLIDASGRIGSAEATGCPAIRETGRMRELMLCEGVSVTQTDVRAIQLAKSALHAGAQLLLDRIGASHVVRVVLAGAFGAHISPLHALTLGMIPDCAPEDVTSAGNAAGHGARMLLCSTAARARLAALARRIVKVETAMAPDFQAHFVAANAIPHATDPYPRLARVVTLPDVAHGAAGARAARRGARRAPAA